jgi:hypothetical protein
MAVPIYVPNLKTILKVLNRSFIFVTCVSTRMIFEAFKMKKAPDFSGAFFRRFRLRE